MTSANMKAPFSIIMVNIYAKFYSYKSLSQFLELDILIKPFSKLLFLSFYCISDVTLCYETGDVRLRPFGMDTKGRLEVCYDGYWGSVCKDDYSDDTIATVVCRQLGYSAKGK